MHRVSMSALEALLLGIVQGLTEFLPISSSAHLLVLPQLLEWTPGGLAFDALLHAGTLLALLVYFRRELVRLLYVPTGGGDPESPRLLLVLAVGTLPIVLAGALGKPLVEHHLRTPGVAIANLVLFGVLLGWADWKGGGSRPAESLRLWEALLIGAAQALALAPGVSRSGVTITAALVLGAGRVEAARFAFLLGIPAIAAATGAAAWEWAHLPDAEATGAAVLAVGVTSAFGSGFLCIKYFMQFLERGSLLWFAAYRFLLAALAASLLLWP